MDEEVVSYQLSRTDHRENRRQILFVGDTSFGESYHEKLANKGKENILTTRGYDHSMQNFKEILSQPELVIANLETPLTNLLKPA